MATEERWRRGARWALDECLSRVVLGLMVGFILLSAWLVVGVSLTFLYYKGLEHGLSQAGAALLAVPVTFVPAWKSWAKLREDRSLISALMGHLWVLNGGVGYALVALVMLAFRGALEGLAGSAWSWPLALAGTAGFLALTGGLVTVNLWLFRVGMSRRVEGDGTLPLTKDVPEEQPQETWG